MSNARPIHEDNPLPGFYQTRAVRNGPWLPAIIWTEPGDVDPETGELMSDDVLCCMINGRRVDPYERWTWLAGHPISADQYFALLGQSSAPGAPPPDQPVDPMNDAPVF